MIISIRSPTTFLISEASNGEQTIDRAPFATANLARVTAESLALLAKPISKRSESESEVRIVTAVIEMLGTAALAALIIEAPPLA